MSRNRGTDQYKNARLSGVVHHRGANELPTNLKKRNSKECVSYKYISIFIFTDSRPEIEMLTASLQTIFYRILTVAISALVLAQSVYSSTTASEHALELTALAEVLGIPMDQDVGPKREKMPEYLETVYDCWSSGSDNCGMPEATSDANVVRSFLGYGESPLIAVYWCVVVFLDGWSS